MKVVYMLEKREMESRRKAVLQDVIKALGTKVAIEGLAISVDKFDEKKIVDLLLKSGVKFQKVS
jgi:hypothetical protein